MADASSEQHAPGLPPRFDTILRLLTEHGWTAEVTPWRPAAEKRAMIRAERDAAVLVASARPTSRPGQPTQWRSRHARYFGQARHGANWHQFPNCTAFLVYATSGDNVLLRSGKPVSSPLESGIPQPQCACGKTAFTSRNNAENAILASKISRSLHGNTRRREIRAYRCPSNPDTWHLTSQPRQAKQAAQSTNPSRKDVQ